MSVYYGSPAPGGYAPSGRVNFGWIGEAFELFKANAGVWLVASVMMFVVPLIVGGILGGIGGFVGAMSAQHTSRGQSPFSSPANPWNDGLSLGVNLVTQVLSWVYSAYIYGGAYHIAVKQVRGELVTMGDIFSGGPLTLKMLGLLLIYGLGTLVGTAFCIVPGLLVSGLLFPAFALIADGEGVFDAISRSVDGMKKDMWNGALFIFVMGLLLLASYFAFCLGEFVTMPMLWLVSALAYRDMIGMPGGSSPSGPAYGMPTQPGVWPPPPSAGPTPPSFGQPPANTPPYS